MNGTPDGDFAASPLRSNVACSSRSKDTMADLNPARATRQMTASGFAARSGNPMGMLKVLRMPTGRVITTWTGDANGN